MKPIHRAATGAEDVHWSLEGLYRNKRDLEEDLRKADLEAKDFADRYRGQVSSLDASNLGEALKRFAALQERLSRASGYAYLDWSSQTDSPERGALLQKVHENLAQIHQQILFFELEWVALNDAHANSFLEHSALTPYKHYLELQRLMKTHLLGESEEKILCEKAVTGSTAWKRLFDETLGSIRFPYQDQKLTAPEVLSKLYETDRGKRRQAALSLTEGLNSQVRHLTFVFNTVLADKASDDRLRGYPTWLSSLNLSNEISDDAVDTLIDAITGRYDLVARFYDLKRKLLGLDEMYDYDRYAPVGEAKIHYSWSQARQLVLEAYQSFHPLMGSIAQDFFERHWIDAAVSAGKRAGAFTHHSVPSAHPYILMNYTGNVRDVQTLAHELGHGVHQYLSRKQGILHADTPLTTAETASVFGEMLAFDRLMKKEKNPGVQLSMLIGKIDDTIATVFRQVALNRFEDRIHTTRRSQGELSAEKFSELWIETQRPMFQGSVKLGHHYRIWWSYIPHFIETPGYVYAYAFGELLALALSARYQQDEAGFAEEYLQLLEAGGSDWPHVLVAKLGIDLNDTAFWNQGLSAIQDLIEQAEDLAAANPSS